MTNFIASFACGCFFFFFMFFCLCVCVYMFVCMYMFVCLSLFFVVVFGTGTKILQDFDGAWFWMISGSAELVIQGRL